MSWELNVMWGQLQLRHWLGMVVVGLGAYHIFRKVSQKKYNFPPGPTKFPIVGNILSLSSEPMYLTFARLAKTYGDIFTFNFGSRSAVILSSHDLMRDIFTKQAVEVADRPVTATFNAVGGDKTIVFGQYKPVLKLQRKVATAGLRKFGTGKALEQIVQKSFFDATALIDKENGKPFDPLQALTMMIYNVIGSIVLGRTFEPDDPIFTTVALELDEFIEKSGNGQWADIFPALKFLPNPVMKHSRAFLDNFLDNLKESWIQHQDDYNPDELTDFLYMLINVKEEIEREEGAGSTSMLEEKHFTGILLDMFFAGTGSSRLTISWTLLLVTAHPEVQIRMQKEIDDVVGRDQVINMSHRAHMPFTEAVLAEAMRMFPASPYSVPRATSCDVELRGYTLPKGTWVMPNLWTIFRDPKVWENPEQFLPERHLDENGEIPKTTSNFLPFSIGRRACVGELTARITLHMLVSSIFQRYTICPPEGETINLKSVSSLQCHPAPYKVVANLRE